MSLTMAARAHSGASLSAPVRRAQPARRKTSWLGRVARVAGKRPGRALVLLAFGISLRLDPLAIRGSHAPRVWLVQVIKVVLMPLAAWVLGSFAFGLNGSELLAVTVIAALPAAQNIYVIASRYEVGELLARDSIFISTMLSVPTITLIAVLLGAG